MSLASARTAARASVGRLVDPLHAALARAGGGAPPGLRRGDGAPVADVPVVVVHLRPGAEQRPDAVLDVVTRARSAAEAFTPVLLVERPALAPLRRGGYVVELVTPRGVAATLEELRRTYAVVAVVAVQPTDLDHPGAVEARLRGAVPPPARGPLAAVRRMLRALEARLP